MKIPERYYQFKNIKALVIVSGAERAELFEASNGEIKNISSVVAEKVKYSDKEGAYVGKTGLFRGGAMLNDINKKERSRFLELLGTKYSKLKANNYDYIALTAPKERLSEIIDALGITKREINKKIKIIKEGNFIHYSTKDIASLLSGALSPFVE